MRRSTPLNIPPPIAERGASGLDEMSYHISDISDPAKGGAVAPAPCEPCEPRADRTASGLTLDEMTLAPRASYGARAARSAAPAPAPPAPPAAPAASKDVNADVDALSLKELKGLIAKACIHHACIMHVHAHGHGHGHAHMHVTC